MRKMLHGLLLKLSKVILQQWLN